MAAVLPLLPERHRPAPKPALLWILGAAAVASCAMTAVLAAGDEELYQPALRVLLVWWITLPYIFAGIVAWRRRPDSAFGPLMILAGFVTQLSILQWTSVPLASTIGQLCDLLVAAPQHASRQRGQKARSGGVAYGRKAYPLQAPGKGQSGKARHPPHHCRRGASALHSGLRNRPVCSPFRPQLNRAANTKWQNRCDGLSPSPIRRGYRSPSKPADRPSAP